jgi:hypothetical protein
MLEIRPARSGQLTARIGGAYLHSPYDPETEARRFAESSLAGACPATVLLLGAELGHAAKPFSASARAPACRCAMTRSWPPDQPGWSPPPGKAYWTSAARPA